MFTIDKNNTITKVKTEVKATVVEFLMDALKEKYGADSVKMVRTGKTSKANEIAFIFDEATDENGEVNPIVITLNPSVKEFSNHTSDKGKVYEPFDFYAAASEYDEYLDEKTAKAEIAAKNKAEKAAKDAAKRAEKANKKSEN